MTQEGHLSAVPCLCVGCRVGPNRHTFTCPACGAKNLTCDALLEHVNDTHKGEALQVVCCAYNGGPLLCVNG